jgi:hypothetical protein
MCVLCALGRMLCCGARVQWMLSLVLLRSQRLGQARNVLIDSLLIAKVADFGFARPMADDEVYQSHSDQLPVRATSYSDPFCQIG